MRFLLLFSICCTGFSLSAQHKLDRQDEFAVAVYQYLDLSGSRQQFEMAIDQMIEMQAGLYPDVPDEFWTEFQQRVREQGFEDIAVRLVPLYREHFTQEELDALVEFYGSEIGQSIAQKNTLVMQGSMQIGAEWGAALGAEIVRDLQEAEDNGKIQRH